ncbi:MAG: aspartate/glutamate racemase family protein, partial [Halieaceae bacterium]|nr:aspartate/glutamate racemase family protein [Halieaceae bacterium]
LYRVKAGERGDELTSALRELAAELEQRGAEVIVAACTEIPLILGPGDTRAPLLCSTSVLVQRTIELARETPPEEF